MQNPPDDRYSGQPSGAGYPPGTYAGYSFSNYGSPGIPSGQSPGSFVAPRSERSQATAFLLSYFLGWLGIDRFYLGYIGYGVLKLLTCGGCGIWWLIDLILIGGGSMKDADGAVLERGAICGQPVKSQMTAVVLSVFLPYLTGGLAAGIDRIYLGYTGLGILKCLTCGGCGIWSLIDTILIGMGKMRDIHGNSLLYS